MRQALELALEALENLFGIPNKWTGEGGGDVAVWRLGGSYRTQQAITAIKEALAQPEQEPVAWEQFYPDIGKPQLTHPPQGIYYTPPQRTWVGLTDEEMQDLWDRYAHMEMMRAIEAKLKDKNL